MNSRGKKQPRIPVTHCTYCGSCDLGIGWHQNEAIVTFRRNGLLGKRMRYASAETTERFCTGAW